MFKNTLKERNSYRIKKHNKGNRPILTVYKSNKNIYAQIIDVEGKVLVSFSSKTKGISEQLNGKTGLEIAYEIGKGIAERALKEGITEVVFNKGPYLYIGRVKALADGAREGGLKF
jgi:large subunit ribosomal protein L18